MNLLIDESLQQEIAHLLSAAGHDAVHVADRGLRGSPDDAVLLAAEREGRVVITADTDFGTLLALSNADGPSVILLRRSGRRAVERVQLILTVLELAAEQLSRGAAVTVDQARLRIRELPIQR